MNYQVRHKTIAGGENIEVDSININGHHRHSTAGQIPLTINGRALALRHLLKSETRTDGISSLEFPPVHALEANLLIKDANNKLNRVIHAGNLSDITTESSDSGLKVKEDSVLASGKQLHVQQSPAPVCTVDTTGHINSFNLWNATFDPYVLGNADADKPDFYSQGLVRQGSSTHGDQFLRKDGQWAQPSLTYSGTVAENFLSLNDTPSSYSTAENKYVRVTYSGGGGLEFNQPTTDEITEAGNLYYTDARVATKTSSLLGSGDISTMKISGDITANSFISVSDRRFKRNIKSIDCKHAAAKLKDLNPCSYFLNVSKQKRKRHGLIAQEVQKVLPEVVITRDDGSLSVDYIDLVPYLIATIQQLQKEIANLKKD